MQVRSRRWSSRSRFLGLPSERVPMWKRLDAVAHSAPTVHRLFNHIHQSTLSSRPIIANVAIVAAVQQSHRIEDCDRNPLFSTTQEPVDVHSVTKTLVDRSDTVEQFSAYQ